MAGVHEIGEDVLLTINTKVATVLTDPSNASYPTVEVYGPTGTSVLAAAVMTASSTGVWIYWWDTSVAAITLAGLYTVVYRTEHSANSSDRSSTLHESIRLR